MSHRHKLMGKTLRLILWASLILVAPLSATVAEKKKASAPTQAQIDCQNRAVNDYWANDKNCDSNLSDLPNDLAQCKSDARADLAREKNRCLAAATAGIGGSFGNVGGAVLDRGPVRNPKRQPVAKGILDRQGSVVGQ